MPVLATLALRVAAEPGAGLAYLRAYPVEKPRAEAGAAGRSREEHAARRALGESDFHDPANPDLGRLQSYDQATAGLPVDGNGFPDWMRALREGRITPRANVQGTATMMPLDLDIVMKNTREMPWVRFPHRAHTEWLDCGNCHPVPFEPRAGATRIQMADIFRGRYCGMCHDRVAFVTFLSCARCHSETPPGSPP